MTSRISKKKVKTSSFVKSTCFHNFRLLLKGFVNIFSLLLESGFSFKLVQIYFLYFFCELAACATGAIVTVQFYWLPSTSRIAKTRESEHALFLNRCILLLDMYVNRILHLFSLCLSTVTCKDPKIKSTRM